ncbi:DegT/DnrJ/EryC1/StrS family aminotransferase [bacterium]|nr:DegT/DnrJ/EryC1/StrS family aminotransferase [bacterium]
MAGREVFDKEEMEAIVGVVKRGVFFRYGYPQEREGIYCVDDFEKSFASYAGARHALGVNSGSSSLKVALEALNLPKGKEVLTPCFTFVATIESIEEAGLKPVLCDIDKTFNISPQDIKRRITKDTVAIMPVHMMGAAADIKEIIDIAKENNLKVVEDTCQSTGASLEGKKLGTFGDFGCFSFDYAKVMTTGEGGILVTNSEELYKQADWYHDHGHTHMSDVPRGVEPRARKGFNYRMNELQGALGVVQLKKLNYIISKQRDNKRRIKNELQNIDGLEFRQLLDKDGDIATFLTILLPDKEKAEELKSKMIESNVTPATLNYWHFTANIEIAGGGSFPESEALLSRSVSIEIKTIMTEEEISKVASSIKENVK